MAKVSLSKKVPKLNLTRRQIFIFREIIELGNQMAGFLKKHEQNIDGIDDFQEAKRLATEWGALMVSLLNEAV